MAGKQVLKRTRSKKFSNLVKEEITRPENVGTTSTACSGTTEGTKKKSRKNDESDIAVVPSSSPEPDSDDDVKFIGVAEGKIGEESKKGKRNGEKNGATKKGVEKTTAIQIIEPEEKPEKKKVNDVSRQKGEGKKEEKKKRKKLEEEDLVLLGGHKIGEIKQRSEGKKGDKKSKGKEVEAKSPEKLKDGSDKKKKVEGEKERTGKKRNEDEPCEGKNDDKKKKVEGEEERTVKRRNEIEKEDEKRKKKKKRQKTEVEEAKNLMNETINQRAEGAKKEKKQEDKKQKKKVEEVEGKKVKKKKNKEEEIEMEENEKNNNVLYQFPMAQVSRIIKSEELNSKIAQEAVFVINKAAEKFLELFCREAYACAFLDHKNHVAYNHLSSVVSNRRRFDFLSDFVPEKVKAEDALAEMSKAEAETESEI